MEQSDIEEQMIKQKLDKDLKYIQKEIIAKQTDGNYCKFSTALNAVAIIGMTEKQYTNYWQNQYRNRPNELPAIIQACADKFDNGLTSQTDMLNLVQLSNDRTADKPKALKLLGGVI